MIEEQAKAKEISKQCIKSLYAFMLHFWPIINPNDKLIPNFHLRYLCDFLQDQFFLYLKTLKEFEALEEGEEIGELPYHKDVIANVPPGTSKSTVFSQMFNAWGWLHAPHFVWLTTSYALDVAKDQSLKTKTIVKSQKYRYLFNGWYMTKYGRPLMVTKDTETDWRTNLGGQRICAATGGAVTGRHAHIIIPDDPMSQQESVSEAYRLQAHNFNDRTLPTRKKNKELCPTYTVMQRLHHDDTTGHNLEKQKEIFHIVLPAEIIKSDDEVKPKRLAKYYVKGLLDPKRMNRKVLQDQKAELVGDYDGQFLQDPRPAGTGLVDTDLVTFVDEPPRGITWDLWVDGAYGKQGPGKKKNDPTGFMVAGKHGTGKNTRVYVKFAVSKDLTLPKFLKYLPTIADESGLNAKSRVRLEPKASGISTRQMANDVTMYSCVDIKSKLVNKSKEEKLNNAAPKIESGKLILVRGGWNQEVIDQWAGKSKHDEYNDLSGYICDRYFKKKQGITKRN